MVNFKPNTCDVEPTDFQNVIQYGKNMKRKQKILLGDAPLGLHFPSYDYIHMYYSHTAVRKAKQLMLLRLLTKSSVGADCSADGGCYNILYEQVRCMYISLAGV